MVATVNIPTNAFATLSPAAARLGIYAGSGTRHDRIALARRAAATQ